MQVVYCKVLLLQLSHVIETWTERNFCLCTQLGFLLHVEDVSQHMFLPVLSRNEIILSTNKISNERIAWFELVKKVGKFLLCLKQQTQIFVQPIYRLSYVKWNSYFHLFDWYFCWCFDDCKAHSTNKNDHL